MGRCTHCWVVTLQDGTVASRVLTGSCQNKVDDMLDILWSCNPVKTGYARRLVFQGLYQGRWFVWGLANAIETGQWDEMMEMDRLTLCRHRANSPGRLVRFPLVVHCAGTCVCSAPQCPFDADVKRSLF